MEIKLKSEIPDKPAQAELSSDFCPTHAAGNISPVAKMSNSEQTHAFAAFSMLRTREPSGCAGSTNLKDFTAANSFCAQLEPIRSRLNMKGVTK
jgi:hypothetical protein